MIKASAASAAFGRLNSWASGYLGKEVNAMKAGMIQDMGQAALKFTASSPLNAATAIGGGAGAVGGMLSSDRDQSWYTGMAQGAFAARNISKHGLSGQGVTGAALGAVYGMFSDDTSIMGGAFMGAGLGAGGRYKKIGTQAYNRAAKATMVKTQKATSRANRVGFGMRAVRNAISRDTGFGWRAGGGKGGVGGNGGWKNPWYVGT